MAAPAQLRFPRCPATRRRERRPTAAERHPRCAAAPLRADAGPLAGGDLLAGADAGPLARGDLSAGADAGPLARGDLLARAHAVRGLEVDEHVGLAQALADGVLEHVGRAVRVLERGARAELH